LHTPHTNMKGRGTTLAIKNRFERLTVEKFDDGWETAEEPVATETRFYDDNSKTLLSKNDSPDVGFTYSINPYRGCEHGCVYCYARPSHEYLGMNAAGDFETKIMVKREAPRLLAEAFQKKSWEPQTIMLSGNTDCYQPAERRLRLTRGCLEVFLKYKNPVSLITKNFLITRDLDILRRLAADGLVHVAISITTLDAALARVMEPRTAQPERRLAAVEMLAEAGVPVGVMVAPIIPGLTEHEIPALLRAASEHGAQFAGMTMLRLPLAVEPIFLEWLERERPLQASRVIAHIKDVRGGNMSSGSFGERMRGTGASADAIRTMFKLYKKKYGLDAPLRRLNVDLFQRDEPQYQLFA